VAKARHRLEIQRSALGDRHPDYATGLNQLALLMIMHGDPEEAEPLLRQALDIRKGALGELHPDYATNLSSLAGLLWARGDLDRAEPLLRQALDIRWQVLGADHAKTTASLSSLDQLLQMKRDLSGHEQRPKGSSAHAPVADPTPVPPSSPSDGPTVEPAPRHEVAEVPPPAAPEPRHEPAPGGGTAGHAAECEPGDEAPGVPLEELDLAGLRRQLDALSGEFASLGEQLARAAEGLQRRRVPAPDVLADNLRAVGPRFAALREAMARSAEALDIPGSRVRAIADRDGLAAMLAELAEAEERATGLAETRRRALAVLDRVPALKHTDQPDFPPLEECQARARERRAEIAAARPLALPDDAAGLASGAHPLATLVALVTENDRLSDDRWTEMLDTLRAEFGKPLAVAVARSRIVLAEDAHP
jgi:tetratricopeptide (TPR) repeat protein